MSASRGFSFRRPVMSDSRRRAKSRERVSLALVVGLPSVVTSPLATTYVARFRE